VIKLLHLRQAWHQKLAEDPQADLCEVDAAIREGAVQRVRPKAMTVAVILAGLLPLFVGEGAGSEVMQRIAAPMIGGTVTAPLLSMLVIPAAYRILPPPPGQRGPSCNHEGVVMKFVVLSTTILATALAACSASDGPQAPTPSPVPANGMATPAADSGGQSRASASGIIESIDAAEGKS